MISKNIYAFSVLLDENPNKVLGKFNKVKGIENDNFDLDNKGVIELYDGFINQEFFDIEKFDCCDLIIEFYDLNGELMNIIEGVASEVNIQRCEGDIKIEILSNPASSLFIRQGALKLWEERKKGLLEKQGSWIDLNNYDRETWLEVALLDIRTKIGISVKENVELNGLVVTDLISFLCELGESILGPGMYIGRGLTALEGCLSENWEIEKPKCLVWNNYEFSRSKFIENNEEDNLSSLEEILNNANILIEKKKNLDEVNQWGQSI